MPKCFYCGTSVPGPELSPHNGELACGDCRTPKEVAMSKDKKVVERKPVFSLNVYEEGKNDQGESNFAIEVSAQMGGFNLTFERTTDEIRDYFTAKKQRRQIKAKERKLRAVTDNED